MNIMRKEVKKAIYSPIIIGLLLLFIVFNFIIIKQHSYIKDELKVLHYLVDKFGYKINDEMEVNLKNYYDEQLKKFKKITNEKISNNYNSVGEFLEANYYYIDNNIYNREEIKFIVELGVVELYFYTIQNIDKVYSEFNIMEKAEIDIEKYGLSGKAADTVRKQYENFGKRYEQLIKNKEHKNLFFLGKAYRMHSLLFKKLFRSIIFEIIILVVLITTYLINYEFENNTENITYSTKIGRNLIKNKLYASIATNILFVTIILVTGLGLYFINYDYSELWNIHISSYLNTESNHMIYMSRYPISFIQYLFLGIGTIYALTLIFTGITFVIAKNIKNNYIVFFIFCIIFGFGLLPSIVPTNSNVIFIKGFTPFMLVMNPHIWFMGVDAFSIFNHYELIITGIWAILLLILSTVSIRRFKRQDI